MKACGGDGYHACPVCRPPVPGPVAVCVWEPTHRGVEGRHGIQVCAECERPLAAIELPGAPAVLVSGWAVPVFQPGETMEYESPGKVDQVRVHNASIWDEGEVARVRADLAFFKASLEWSGDGWVWAPKDWDYRIEPTDAAKMDREAKAKKVHHEHR